MNQKRADKQKIHKRQKKFRLQKKQLLTGFETRNFVSAIMYVISTSNERIFTKCLNFLSTAVPSDSVKLVVSLKKILYSVSDTRNTSKIHFTDVFNKSTTILMN